MFVLEFCQYFIERAMDVEQVVGCPETSIFCALMQFLNCTNSLVEYLPPPGKVVCGLFVALIRTTNNKYNTISCKDFFVNRKTVMEK